MNQIIEQAALLSPEDLMILISELRDLIPETEFAKVIKTEHMPFTVQNMFKAFEEKKLTEIALPKSLEQLQKHHPEWHIQDLQKLRQTFAYTKHLGKAMQPKVFQAIIQNGSCEIDEITVKVSKSSVIRIKAMYKKGMLSIE